MALNRLLYCALTTKELYWYIAPTYSDAKDIGWKKLLDTCNELDIKYKKNEVELSVEFPNAGIIKFKGASDALSLKGRGIQGVVIDECATIKEMELLWKEVILPSLLDKNGWCIFIGTPRGKRNYFYELYEQYPHFHATSYDNPQNTPEKIEELKNALNNDTFLIEQELMAVFHESSVRNVFKHVDDVVVLPSLGNVENKQYVIGVDFGQMQDYTVACVMERYTNRLVDFYRSQERYDIQVRDIVNLARKWNNAEVTLDVTGVGRGPSDYLKSENIHIKEYNLTNESKNALISKLILFIEQKYLSLPKIDVLINELKDYEQEQTTITRFNAPPGKHDDCVISLALAVWTLERPVSENYSIDTLNRISQTIYEQQQNDYRQ